MGFIKKLNSRGISHYILPVAVVMVVSAIGVYVLKYSHAAALPCYNTTNSSTGESVSVCPVEFATSMSSSGTGIYAQLNAYNTPSNKPPTKTVIKLVRCSSTGANCSTISYSNTTSYTVSNTSSWPEYQSITAWKPKNKAYSYKACSVYTDSTGWQVNKC